MSILSVLALGASEGGTTADFTTNIKLPSIAGEGTHLIATVLMGIVKWITRIFGLSGDENVVAFLYVALVVALGLGLGVLVKWCVVKTVGAISRRKPFSMLMELDRSHFFLQLGRIIPPIFMILLIQFSLSTSWWLVAWVEKALWIYVVFQFTLSMGTLIDAIWKHIDSRENKKRLPLRGVAQVARVLLWFLAAIIIVAILLSKSPAALLAGLGAFAAVLMLVFKDSILGVVAGVQLSENDMLRVGDWIAVDGTTANGNVTEVSLTSVKVQNWDKTITTVPPYSLVSGSFKNYRSMQESQTRRIQRTYLIDADTVRFLSEKELDDFRSIPFMDNYITKKLAQRKDGQEANVANPEGLADGTIDTNLGLLRAYVKMYLDSLPTISHTDDCFVNTLQQTQGGIPFQLYCFTSTSKWIPYEGIQSEIFEHLAAMLPCFGLYVFENASGRDEIANGILEAGGDPQTIIGLPSPIIRPAEQAPKPTPQK